MDFSLMVMWLGFILASYSVVGNDVIQTLGTFLTSNENERPWWVLWLYAATLLVGVLVYGHMTTDVAYGRLDKFTFPEVYHWYYLLPPLVLLSITRFGVPVSTTFMILTLFSLRDVPADFTQMINSVFDGSTVLGGMIKKSVMGYIIAFTFAGLMYVIISRWVEKYIIQHSPTPRGKTIWTILQWLATGFLWTQWLTQDLANIYIYLRGGKELTSTEFAFSIAVLVALLGFIFYSKGGAIQDVVRKKTNTADIRSATIIDFMYGIVLFVFKDDYFGLWGGKLPMSTTWVFIGLLAGRELAIRYWLDKTIKKKIWKMVAFDLGKIFAGLIISVVLVFLIRMIAHL